MTKLHSAAQRSRPVDKRSSPMDNLLYFLAELPGHPEIQPGDRVQPPPKPDGES